MVDLDDEGNLVRVLARHRAQHAEGRGHRVAAAFDGQLDDVFRVEIDRVGREGGAAGMLDALVHRQDGEVAGAAQAPVVEQGLQGAQHAGPDVFLRHHAVNEIGPGQVQHVLGIPLHWWVSRLSASAPSNAVISVMANSFFTQRDEANISLCLLCFNRTFVTDQKLA